jgi:hypothetical protein
MIPLILFFNLYCLKSQSLKRIQGCENTTKGHSQDWYRDSEHPYWPHQPQPPSSPGTEVNELNLLLATCLRDPQRGHRYPKVKSIWGRVYSTPIRGLGDSEWDPGSLQ